MIKESTRNGALLNLMLTKKEELVGDVDIGDRLGCSDHEKVEFRVQREGSMAKKQDRTLDFRRADLISKKICLEESHKTHPWWEDRSGKAC